MNKFQLDKNENLIIHNNREITISKYNWLGYLIIEKKPTIHKLRVLPISIIYGLVFSLSLVLIYEFTHDYVQFSTSFDFVSRYKILEIFYDLQIFNQFRILFFISTTVFWWFFKRKTKRWGAYIFFHGKKYEFLLKKKMVQKINKDRLNQLTIDRNELYKVLDNLEIYVKNENM